MRRDVLAIDETVLDEQMNHAVQKSDIRAWLQWQVEVCHHRSLCHAGVGHDHGPAGICVEVLAKDRVVVGDGRAEEKNDIRLAEMLVRALWTSAANRRIMPGASTGRS